MQVCFSHHTITFIYHAVHVYQSYKAFTLNLYLSCISLNNNVNCDHDLILHGVRSGIILDKANPQRISWVSCGGEKHINWLMVRWYPGPACGQASAWQPVDIRWQTTRACGDRKLGGANVMGDSMLGQLLWPWGGECWGSQWAQQCSNPGNQHPGALDIQDITYIDSEAKVTQEIWIQRYVHRSPKSMVRDCVP